MASTLGVISDDGTPGKVREQLTGLVKQVTATLKAGQEPDVQPEDRSRVFLVVQRTTPALKMVGDPETPPKLRGLAKTLINNVSNGAEQNHGSGEEGLATLWASSGVEPLADADIPKGLREDVGEESTRVSQHIRRASDPESSPEERDEARREMREGTARMRDAQEEAAAARDRPDTSLGKAAEVCTNAIFGAVQERKLSKGLKDVTPQSWDSAGVKDFWKASAEGNAMLDVRAQLQNDEHTHAPFEVARLITNLADVVPEKDLTVTLAGKPAAHCKQTAVYLDRQGITAGDWLSTPDW
ncbi:hypothetical protein [Streptomyces sp. NBC_01092]|uniref:hypothetical protein n=1 Tax=Streptomyces sp. NBC_01092 TaxID=2903748 RepID=UPI00386A0E09|nr:hypothetical protein OG254_16885 [Streptomyces sp. NBC_01092]